MDGLPSQSIEHHPSMEGTSTFQLSQQDSLHEVDRPSFQNNEEPTNVADTLEESFDAGIFESFDPDGETNASENFSEMGDQTGDQVQDVSNGFHHRQQQSSTESASQRQAQSEAFNDSQNYQPGLAAVGETMYSTSMQSNAHGAAALPSNASFQHQDQNDQTPKPQHFDAMEPLSASGVAMQEHNETTSQPRNMQASNQPHDPLMSMPMGSRAFSQPQKMLASQPEKIQAGSSLVEDMLAAHEEDMQTDTSEQETMLASQPPNMQAVSSLQHNMLEAQAQSMLAAPSDQKIMLSSEPQNIQLNSRLQQNMVGAQAQNIQPSFAHNSTSGPPPAANLQHNMQSPQPQNLQASFAHNSTNELPPAADMIVNQHQNSSTFQPLNTQASNAQNSSTQPAVTEPVIELLEDDDDDDDDQANKRQRTEDSPADPASTSHAARYSHMPDWMKQKAQQEQRAATSIVPGNSFSANRLAASAQAAFRKQIRLERPPTQHEPIYLDLPPEFEPTWTNPLPLQVLKRPVGHRSFELSLLNVKEFTITGLPITYEGPPTAVAGLRKKIKEVSKGHGKAVFERDKEGAGGRWKIPLGSYNQFFSYLISDPMCRVIGISEEHLKIASLGKARLEKGYPSVRKLITLGVPRGLATALAPFQRGGVDFVVEKKGRSLIADEMGLGKTIQAIASLAVFHKEWPVLILTPSSARYHWENEFQHWLGRDSPVNKEQQQRLNLGGESDDEEDDDGDEPIDESNCMKLLRDNQIHVLTSSKDDILPRKDTLVVVCSYGLAPALVQNGKIRPSLFRCAIVDESHMLKNMSTKRTSTLVPILHATNRCVLLSGTPALAKPSELWPQLKILSTAGSGWWDNESDFIGKYVKRSSPVRRAELHAMLTGTVMIRRMKSSILKSLPKKLREKAVVDVSTSALRKEFHQCMALLREGKGVLGKLARQHTAPGALEESVAETQNTDQELSQNESRAKFEETRELIKQEHQRKYKEGTARIHHTLSTISHQLNETTHEMFVRLDGDLRRELGVWYRERVQELQIEQPQLQDPELTRKSVLNKMYTLTARAKIPLLVNMIQRWLNDPTKGKLCVFAHHIFVLDELISQGGLSNAKGSNKRFIRIDGSTNPKERQAQIKKFQTDPSVRIAILGITAAGVAVTLTAASTVWFAELFWTPALMIQAEDRCHRIGQNARVQCLYFVAVGTLDELLWKLLEKKFQDLGEFVEGQEKLKLTIHKHYHGKKELLSTFTLADADESGDELNSDDDSDEGKELLDLEHDLEGDIEKLGQEELTMIAPDGAEDEFNVDSTPDEAVSQPGDSEPVLGRSEEEAILLSDDEDENAHAESKRESTPAPAPAPNGDGKSGQSAQNGDSFDISKPLSQCQAYNILFEGPSFGIQLLIHNGRPVVGKRLDPKYMKPAVGDTAIAINGQRLPLTESLDQVTSYLKHAISRNPVQVTFLENEFVSSFIQRRLDVERKRQEELSARMARPINPTKEGRGVIELLDDE